MSVILKLPLTAPTVVGLNTKLIVQDAPPATVLVAPVPQVEPVPKANWAGTVMALSVNGAVPVLASVKVWPALVEPFKALPKSRDAGKLTIGTILVDVIDTTSGLWNGSLVGIDKVPSLAADEAVTLRLQLAPEATWIPELPVVQVVPVADKV